MLFGVPREAFFVATLFAVVHRCKLLAAAFAVMLGMPI